MDRKIKFEKMKKTLRAGLVEKIRAVGGGYIVSAHLFRFLRNLAQDCRSLDLSVIDGFARD